MNITIDYFNSEVCQFRKLMGDKAFWTKTPEQRQIAIDGLTYVYLNLSNSTQEEINHAAITLDSTLTEYTKRESMLKLYS